MRNAVMTMAVAALLFGCASSKTDVQTDTQVLDTQANTQTFDAQTEAQAFIDSYTKEYLVLQYDWAKADWNSNTKIVDGDTTAAFKTRQAHEAFARFTGSAGVRFVPPTAITHAHSVSPC